MTPTPTWIEEEIKNLTAGSPDIERLPTVKFETGKIVELNIDASKPFQKWTGKAKGSDKEVTKSIIPCTVKGEQQNWWVNIRNPILKEVMNRLKEGKTTVKIIQTGTQANTRYTLVEG